MKTINLIHKPLPQNPDIWVSVPDYKEPILPVSNGFGWYGLQAYDFQGDKLMCHECGRFFNSLGKHTKDHKLNPQTYRDKYGLLAKTKLVSKKTTENYRKRFKLHPEQLAQARERFIANMHKGSAVPRKIGERKAKLEYQNLADSCNAQLIRRLISIASACGKIISEKDIHQYDTALTALLVKRFGSLNKAKQLAKLAVYTNEPIYTNQLIIEDMVTFYRKYHRWPSCKDYDSGELICKRHIISHKFGGLQKLRQEAQQLKDEQDKRPTEKDMALIASKIEMEYAGKARV